MATSAIVFIAQLENRSSVLHSLLRDKHLIMRVIAFSSLEELAPYADSWDRLAGGVPFRSWTWSTCWWRQYGENRADAGRLRLLVLGVFDPSDRLVGLAPWHLRRTRTQGRVLRWLGSGEVCSDYLSVLCMPPAEDAVAAALADHLAGPRRSRDFSWDLLEINGVDARDRPVARLVEGLAERGCLVHRDTGMNCWRIDLPPTLDEYLGMLSKNHRKQVRRFERDLFESGRVVLHAAQNRVQLSEGTDLLVHLHQQRWRSLGKPGCFTSKRFEAFHREVMPLMLSSGQLQLYWLEMEGRRIAVDYHLTGEGVGYAYQGGIDPAALAYSPGRLMTQAVIRRAIAQGGKALDYLRGDEPYKAQFGAVPRPSLALRIVPNQSVSRLRHGLWFAGKRVRGLMK
ncbi:MAG: GNAT family N-acetyltransferase [Thermoguttaceae bacterium]